jgi:hypothetical protein
LTFCVSYATIISRRDKIVNTRRNFYEAEDFADQIGQGAGGAVLSWAGGIFDQMERKIPNDRRLSFGLR